MRFLHISFVQYFLVSKEGLKAETMYSYKNSQSSIILTISVCIITQGLILEEFYLQTTQYMYNIYIQMYRIYVYICI